MQPQLHAGYERAAGQMTALIYDAALADDEIDTLERFVRAHRRRLAALTRQGAVKPSEYDALSITEGRLQRWQLFRARLKSEIRAGRSD